MRDGICRAWHENGVLAKEYTLVNDRVEGSIREWHDNGVLAKEVPFVGGRMHGIVRQWNREGELLGEYTMTQGWGVERIWNEDGSLQMESESLLKEPDAMRATVYDDLGKAHRVFLWNGRSVSKRKFYERLARELEVDVATAESLRQPLNPPAQNEQGG